MKNIHLAAGAVAVLLSMACSVWGGDETAPVQAGDSSEAAAPTNELLMYFDEKDLVTATKRSTSLRKVPAIATIITADEIRNMGARNMIDIIRMVPGFGVSRSEFGLYFVEMRGIRSSLSEKILVMLDGHPLNKNFTDSAIYAIADMLPVENIKQVEVVRGPGSALYGNSAFLATINIISRDAEEIGGLEFKAGGGEHNTFKMNLVGGKTIGDSVAVSGSIDRFKTGGQKLNIEADSLTGTPFSKAPGPADLSFNQTDAYLKAVYGDFSFRGHYLGKHIGSYVGYNFALADDSYDDLKNYWTELAYDLQIREGLSTNFKFRFDHYTQDAQLKMYPNGFGGSFPEGVIGRPLLKNQTIGFEQQLDWDISKGNHLIIGASFEELRQYDVKEMVNFMPIAAPPYMGAYLGQVQELPGFNWNRNVNRQVWAAYLQDEWQIAEKVNLTSGVRYDHYSDFGSSLNPRIGLVWSFLDNADLKILYGQAFRAPNFIELYSVNNPKFIGNPELKPEYIRTYEAGLVYRLNRYFAFDINYYYSLITDQIVWDGSTMPARNSNIGKTVTQGVELGMNGAVTDDIKWKLTYTFQDPRDYTTDQLLPNVPIHRASGSINYTPNKYLNLHSDLLWTGARRRASGDDRPEMPAYTTVDLAVTLKNFFNSLEIQAAVHNLFDERFRDPDTSEALKLVPGDFPREGISATITASYKF